MATRGQIKQRKKRSEMSLFEEEPKRTTRKTRRGHGSATKEAAPSAGGTRTSRKAMRDKQAAKRAAEKAAEAAKPKVIGGRGRAAGKKGLGAKLPAKTATTTKPATTKATTTKAVPRVVAKAPGLGGKVKTVLLGKDQKFGGERGLIDFLPGKSRPKKKVKRTGSAAKMSSRKFAGGGMASKMSAKGGARGGKKMMMPGGMKNGGLAMTTINGRKVPAFAADGKGPNDLAKKKKNGGMMKSKGMAKGGAMTKKGMAKGGAMTKKGMAKGGAAMKKKGYAKGGAKMPMKKDPKTGKMIPAFAMDGKGKMAKGGMMKKKGYAKGGATMKKKGMAKGGAAMTLAKIRAAAKKKGYKLVKA